MVGVRCRYGPGHDPATNAIMSAVRARGRCRVRGDNTVRQVPARWRGHLGSLLQWVPQPSRRGRPGAVAARLDHGRRRSQLRRSAQVGPTSQKDASESIGGALEYAR